MTPPTHPGHSERTDPCLWDARTLCANISRCVAANKTTRLKSPGEVEGVRGQLGLSPVLPGNEDDEDVLRCARAER